MLIYVRISLKNICCSNLPPKIRQKVHLLVIYLVHFDRQHVLKRVTYWYLPGPFWPPKILKKVYVKDFCLVYFDRQHVLKRVTYWYLPGPFWPPKILKKFYVLEIYLVHFDRQHVLDTYLVNFDRPNDNQKRVRASMIYHLTA